MRKVSAVRGAWCMMSFLLALLMHFSCVSLSVSVSIILCNLVYFCNLIFSAAEEDCKYLNMCVCILPSLNLMEILILI
ncbi:hypothetical protein M758_1G133000 [Ceratodon purpureus]|nr:hypothetical protein M758_1G133000 [Ceratodon purpureus]